MSVYLFLLVVTVTTVMAERIQTPLLTNWGRWGPWEHCPRGLPVNAVRMKAERDGGKRVDDTALNAVALGCTETGNREITSTQGQWGSWHAWDSCGPGEVIVGFQLRTQPKIKGDNTAANSIKMKCSDGEIVQPGGGLHWGSWTKWQQCSKGKAVCGIRTQVVDRLAEGKHGSIKDGSSLGFFGRAYDSVDGDDTALNNVQFRCCTNRSRRKRSVPVD